MDCVIAVSTGAQVHVRISLTSSKQASVKFRSKIIKLGIEGVPNVAGQVI